MSTHTPTTHERTSHPSGWLGASQETNQMTTYETGTFVELYPDPTHEGSHPDDVYEPRRFAVVLGHETHPGNDEWITSYTVVESYHPSETLTVKPGQIARTADAELVAVAVLNQHPSEPIPAEMWHSGGGVMCARVDVAPLGGKPQQNDPFLLITDGADFGAEPGTFAVGYYDQWDDEGRWPDGSFPTVPMAELYALVCTGADQLTSGRLAR